MKKQKAVAVLAASLALLFGLALWALAAPDQAVSRAERRKLAQRPEATVETVLSGAYMTDLEEYFLDQFPARDTFRAIQAGVRFGLLRQKDTNGVFLYEGSACKLEYPLEEKQVLYGANKLQSILETHLQGMNVRLAVIPDKSWFAADAGYPHLDYGELVSILRENVDAEYVDLFDLLTLDDYYRTDSHWRQERLPAVAQTLADSFGLGVDLTPPEGFTAHELSPFYGVYCGQSALPLAPDTLTYLTSPAIDAAVMTILETEDELPVYTLDRFDGMDGYDVFAAGAQPIVTLESPLARTDRELIVFRDSYAGSLAPLFLEGYRRVTLIDLRYFASALLPDYVEFADQDVLFLYSTTLLNSAMLLK